MATRTMADKRVHYPIGRPSFSWGVPSELVEAGFFLSGGPGLRLSRFHSFRLIWFFFFSLYFLFWERPNCFRFDLAGKRWADVAAVAGARASFWQTERNKLLSERKCRRDWPVRARLAVIREFLFLSETLWLRALFVFYYFYFFIFFRTVYFELV